jgi:hypothetical protein
VGYSPRLIFKPFVFIEIVGYFQSRFLSPLFSLTSWDIPPLFQPTNAIFGEWSHMTIPIKPPEAGIPRGAGAGSGWNLRQPASGKKLPKVPDSDVNSCIYNVY